jgi:two-component system, chemotaxis family, chemotaxis protein CheY
MDDDRGPGRAAVILAVDDSANTRRLVCTVLAALGHVVVEAVNGREALQAARRHGPDLILSDYNMPELNGLALLQAIRSDPQLAGVPFVVLTTETRPETRRLMMAAGADGWLEKPFKIPDLLGQLEAALRRGAHRPMVLRRTSRRR